MYATVGVTVPRDNYSNRRRPILSYVHSNERKRFQELSQDRVKRLLTKSCLSVCASTQTNSTPTGRIFMKFNIWVFFDNLSRKLILIQNFTRITSTLHENQYTFMITSSSVLLRLRNVSDKFVEKIRTRILYSIFFFFLKSCSLWDNVESYCTTGQTTDDYLAHAHCMLDD
jgi:hypothetical protein